MTDPIADYLTRLRNAIQAKHRVVEVPASNLKKEITKILFEKGYILNYKFVEDGPQGTIKVALKYDPVNKVNAIKKLERISSPGLRQYTGYKEMPRVINAKENTNLRNNGCTIRIFSCCNFDGCDEVFLSVCAQSPDRELGTCEDDRFA